MSNNPYSPPQANVADPVHDVAGELRDSPSSTPFGHGWRWLSEGFTLFKGSPLIWIVNLILFTVLLFVLLLVPFVGSVAQILLTPVFMGGLMLGANAIHEGDKMTIAHLFSAFGKRPGALMAVGAFNLVAMIVVVIIAMGASGASLAALGALDGGELSPEQIQAMLPILTLFGLIFAALFIPITMLTFFAPVLLVMHEDVSVFRSFGLSFMGCIKNILPFLLYGLIMILLAIVATIPIGLGWLIVGPMLFASVYAAYRDIFIE